MSPEEYGRKLEVLRTYCEASHRRMSDIELSTTAGPLSAVKKVKSKRDSRSTMEDSREVMKQLESSLRELRRPGGHSEEQRRK